MFLGGHTTYDAFDVIKPSDTWWTNVEMTVSIILSYLNHSRSTCTALTHFHLDQSFFFFYYCCDIGWKEYGLLAARTGPKALLSMLCEWLSPSTQQWPCGIVSTRFLYVSVLFVHNTTTNALTSVGEYTVIR